MSVEVVLAFISVLVTPVVAAAVSYGMTKARINGLAESVRELKANRYMTRDEYENRHGELRDLILSTLKREPR